MTNAIRLCLLPALFAVLAGAAGGAAAQQRPLNFTAEPAPGSSLDREGSYFVIRAKPGATVEQAIIIRNDSQRPVELRIAGADAATGAYGGISYGLPDESPTRVGRWISFDRPSVHVPGGATVRVPFIVAVPKGLPGGEHVGGIAIWAPSTLETKDAERNTGQAGATVTIQTRRVIAVLVRLPGPAEPNLVVTGVTPAARSDGVYLDIAIENRGTRLTKAKGVLRLVEEGFNHAFAVDTLVPGTAAAYPVKWAQSPRDGAHRVRVELRYGARETSWEGTFTIGEKVADELVERGSPGRVTKSPYSPATVAAVAAAAAAGAVLLAGGVVWLVLRRRSRRDDDGRPPPDDGSGDDPRAVAPPFGGNGSTREAPAVVAGAAEPSRGRDPSPERRLHVLPSASPLSPPPSGQSGIAMRARLDVAPRVVAPPSAAAALVSGDDEPAMVEEVLRIAGSRATVPGPPATPLGPPAPLVAATAAAVVGSALWLLLRRRASAGS